MDIIEGLPQSKEFDCILTIVDRFSKQAIFIPCDKHLDSLELARLFVTHVFSKHGVLAHASSDRGSEFMSDFSTSLGKLLEMWLHFTSGWHPSVNGQAERLNQMLEQYLRIYCNYQQLNWSDLLPLMEFVYNNTPNATTGVSPFFTNKGYNPLLTVHPEKEVSDRYARQYALDLDRLHQFLREQITHAQEAASAQANHSRLPPPDLQVRDKVWIASENLPCPHPSRKLSDEFIGPFLITEKILDVSFQVKLGESWLR
jgi:hypothetical protein